MNIFENNGQLWTTSREIANKMNKGHKYVLRDIRKIISKIEKLNLAGTKFEPSTYNDENNKIQPEYLLNQIAVDLLITGYDILRRAEIIEEFHAMKRYLEETKQTEIYNKWRLQDIEIQKNGHMIIKNTLQNASAIDYKKANLFVGKAANYAVTGKRNFVSKKKMEDKNKDMLKTRQIIFLDYINALEITGDHQQAQDYVKRNGNKGKYKVN